MIVKYAIANISPVDLAAQAQIAGLEGSVTGGYGFGPTYGVEPTTFVEVVTSNVEPYDRFIQQLLFKLREKCALRIVDGEVSLIYVSGIVDFV